VQNSSGIPCITPYAAGQGAPIVATTTGPRRRSWNLSKRALEQEDVRFARGYAGVAEAERAIEGLGGRHAGERVKTNAPVAKPTSLGHDRQRQGAPEPAAPLPRAHVETLHL